MVSQRRFAGALGLALLLIWIVLAIRPVSRSDWLLENTLVFLAVPLIAWFGPRLPLSNASYACLFLFFVLHLIGAHYTYSEVPFLASDTGRNHYDRLAHFLYGLLMARAAARDLAVAAAGAVPHVAWPDLRGA